MPTAADREPRARMGALGWLVVVLAVLVAGWLAFDGARAFIVGDYVTPVTGPYAGQLGPWADLVMALGIDPRSPLMKGVHLGLGCVWLAFAAAFVLRLPRAWEGMLLCAVLSLWYLPFGTILGILQIVLLLHPRLRPARS